MLRFTLALANIYATTKSLMKLHFPVGKLFQGTCFFSQSEVKNVVNNHTNSLNFFRCMGCFSPQLLSMLHTYIVEAMGVDRSGQSHENCQVATLLIDYQ